MGEKLLHAGRIVPVYPLTAGLTAIRLPGRHPRGARQGRPRLSRSTCRPRSRRRGPCRSPRRSRRRTTRRSFPGRDAALRRLAFDELLALQLGMVERRRQRVRARPEPVGSTARRRAIRAIVERHRRTGRRGDRPDRRIRSPMDAIRDDLARPTPMLRLLQGDVGSGKTAVAAYALAATRAGLPGRAPRPDRPARAPAPRHGGALLEDVGIGVTLLTGSLTAKGRKRRGDRLRPGAGRRRDARRCSRTRCRSPISGLSSSTSSIGSGSTSAALSRRRPGVTARAPDDRDAHPADARSGPVRRSRRVRPADAAGRPGEDPDRRPAPPRARRHVAEGPRRGGLGPSDVRGGAVHRGERRSGR